MKRLSSSLSLCLTAAASLLALAGCASPGSYPSLARRDAERITGSAAPAALETPAATVPDAPSAGLPERLAALVSKARGAHARFAERRARAEALVSSAAGSPVASETWAVATVAVSELESARSEAMIAMADLDAMHADERVAHHDEPSADGKAIGAARDTVTAIIADEDAVLGTLRGRL